jgi:hypothetical protein
MLPFLVVTAWLFDLAAVSILFAPFLLILTTPLASGRSRSIPAIWLASWLLWVLSLWINPGGIYDWVLD